ncbi:coadhesin-like [Hydractinia symbiolongicarpus]|uniref:coadhesin-like n=1 Tax=Hydractinia symbiolongicarpus TaxID=13093 RepID=UPI00254DBD56|nr:coadhesin-like [Hydractinia symbiolongicarpus]
MNMANMKQVILFFAIMATTSKGQLVPCSTATLSFAVTMDGSSSIRANEFQQQKDFIKRLITRIDVSGNSNAGLVQFASSSQIHIRCNDAATSGAFNTLVDGVTSLTSATCIKCGLDKAQELLSGNGCGRTGENKIIFLMVDGNENIFPSQVVTTATNLRNSGYVIYALAIGNIVTAANASLLTGSADRVFSTQFADLATYDIDTLYAALTSTYCTVSQTGWSHWGQWSSCSNTCDPVGVTPSRSRTRSCQSGATCPGFNTTIVSCNENIPCPGVLTSWGKWSVCSATCRENGASAPTRTRSRQCDNPSLGGNCGGASLTEPEICNNASCFVISCSNADISYIIVIDSSSSIKRSLPDEWSQEKTFVKNFAAQLGLGTNPRIRVGVVNYGTYANIVATCDSTETSNLANFNALIDALPPILGGTAIYGALLKARDLYTGAGCNRAGELRVVLFLTDGFENVEFNYTLRVSTENLVRSEALIYVGAIGTDVRLPELVRITGNSSLIFTASNFSELSNIDAAALHPRVVSHVCQVGGVWGSWSAFGSCSISCGVNGVKTRTRECRSPVTNALESDCVGSANNTHACFEGDCAGSWSQWSAFGSCSATCHFEAVGSPPSQLRTRTCVGATGAGNCGGGLTSETRSCNVQVTCPVISCSNADISYIIVIDSSNSIKRSLPDEWSQEKTFVKNFAAQLGLGTNPRIRVGVVNYGTYANIVATCDSTETSNLANFNALIDALPPILGGTAIYGALLKARDLYTGAGCNRAGELRVVLFLTDGFENVEFNYTVRVSTENLVRSEALIYVGAIGTDVRLPELVRITGNSSLIFTASNFSELSNIDAAALHPRVVSHVCQVGGVWGSWSAFGSCSISCGVNGVKTRTRECRSPVTNALESDCVGSANDTHACFEGDCAGSWSQWSAFGSCSATCHFEAVNSPPSQMRTRTCVGATEAGNCGGGLTSETRSCNVQVTCPDNEQDNIVTVVVITIVATLVVVVITIAIILKCKGSSACNSNRQENKESENADSYDDVVGTPAPQYADLSIQSIQPSNYAELATTRDYYNACEDIEMTKIRNGSSACNSNRQENKESENADSYDDVVGTPAPQYADLSIQSIQPSIYAELATTRDYYNACEDIEMTKIRNGAIFNT